MTRGRQFSALSAGADQVALAATVGNYLVVGENTGIVNIFNLDGTLSSTIPLNEADYFCQVVGLSPTQMAIAYQNNKIKIYDLTSNSFTHEFTPPADFKFYRMTVSGDRLILLGDNPAEEKHSVLLSYDISDKANLQFNAPQIHQVPLHHTHSIQGYTGESFDYTKQVEIFGADGYVLYVAPDRRGFYIFNTELNTCSLLKMPAKIVAADIWKDGRILIVVDYTMADERSNLTNAPSEIFLFDCHQQELQLVAAPQILPLNISVLNDGEHYIYENHSYYIKSIVNPDLNIETNIQTHGRIHHLLATDSGKFIHLNLENFALVDMPQYEHKLQHQLGEIKEAKQTYRNILDEHVLPVLIPGIIDQVDFADKVRESQTINVISQQNVAELFKKIYQALLAGESRFFKADFMKDKGDLTPSELIQAIKANNQEPEVKKAWELANKYLDKPINDRRLFSEMYLYAFEQSRFFSRAVVDNQTFYSSKSLKSYLDTNYGGLVPEKDINKIDPESRTAKIKSAIRRSY
jgi:hypothetical protein